MCVCVYISRPQWMAPCVPPDLILTVLEGMTAIIHYCLLDPTSQYHQVRVLVSHFWIPCFNKCCHVVNEYSNENYNYYV